MKTKRLIQCSLFTAIICVISPFSVMTGPVPVTGTLFALALTAFCTGSMKGATATLIYILAGIIGLPVFSGFKGGIGAIVGPTGGFVFSYVFVVLILGLCKNAKKKSTRVLLYAGALAICYVFGIAWYMFITKAGFMGALMLCVVPFIPFDVLKLYGAYMVSKAIEKRVK